MAQAFPGSTPHPLGFGEIDARTLHEGAGATRVVDVRNPHEWAGGHMPGAELVPLGAFVSAAQDWDREAPIVLVCHSGMRSADAARYLVQVGFRDVYNLRGGMVAWANAGLPVER